MILTCGLEVQVGEPADGEQVRRCLQCTGAPSPPPTHPAYVTWRNIARYLECSGAQSPRTMILTLGLGSGIHHPAYPWALGPRVWTRATDVGTTAHVSLGTGAQSLDAGDGCTESTTHVSPGTGAQSLDAGDVPLVRKGESVACRISNALGHRVRHRRISPGWGTESATYRISRRGGPESATNVSRVGDKEHHRAVYL